MRLQQDVQKAYSKQVPLAMDVRADDSL